MENKNENQEPGCFFGINAFLVCAILFVFFLMKCCDTDFKDTYEDDKPLENTELVEEFRGNTDSKGSQTTTAGSKQKTKKSKQTTAQEPQQQSAPRSTGSTSNHSTTRQETTPTPTTGSSNGRGFTIGTERVKIPE